MWRGQGASRREFCGWRVWCVPEGHAVRVVISVEGVRAVLFAIVVVGFREAEDEAEDHWIGVWRGALAAGWVVTAVALGSR